MRFDDWESAYRQIIADFGFSESEDAESARALVRVLRPWQVLPNVERSLKENISGAAFLVLGPCLSKERIGIEIKEIIRKTGSRLVSVGEGTKNCVDLGITPSMIFTDLDGFPGADVVANQRGALAFIHAHGDNRLWLEEWVPRFRGRIVPTCQCRPIDGIYNWGGFTDGDRACCTLAHFGASKVKLLGFDFSRPCGAKKTDIAVKKKKLAWAKRIIESLDLSLLEQDE
ncbi:MAG: 6-hydroxymethylpterin diphosphokinase MptE-like protein [Thermoplasmata archaeon]